MKRALAGVFAALLLGVVGGCASVPVTDSSGRVYHCVDTARPIPPPNTWAKKLPLEVFEYGDYRLENRPTVGTGGHCATLLLPKTAYLRYRVDGQVIEKRFDLSSLDVRRVQDKTVEFYVDDDKVEVRLVTPVRGNWPIKEVIIRQ